MQCRVFCAWMILLLLAAGCTPNSVEDFQSEGEALSRSLCAELRKIHTREDLIQALPQMKKKFEAYVDLLISAKEYQQKHGEEGLMEVNLASLPAGESLFWEMKRIYAMEGGREVMEKAQRESLIRLDAFERSLIKQNKAKYR